MFQIHDQIRNFHFQSYLELFLFYFPPKKMGFTHQFIYHNLFRFYLIIILRSRLPLIFFRATMLLYGPFPSIIFDYFSWKIWNRLRFHTISMFICWKSPVVCRFFGARQSDALSIIVTLLSLSAKIVSRTQFLVKFMKCDNRLHNLSDFSRQSLLFFE